MVVEGRAVPPPEFGHKSSHSNNPEPGMKLYSHYVQEFPTSYSLPAQIPLLLFVPDPPRSLPNPNRIPLNWCALVQFTTIQ